MAEPQFLNEEQVADSNKQYWLHKRVAELERQLRLRSILLVGAVALSASLGSFIVASFYGSERPSVALVLAPSFNTPGRSPSVTWKGEQPSIDGSQAWAVGEERIEVIAALHFDAQRTQTPTEQLTTTARYAEWSEALQPEESRWLVRDCSPVSPDAAISASLNHNGSRAALANEGMHYAATDFVNLRAAPSNHAEVLKVVAQGDLVRRTGREMGWLQVEYGDRPASSITDWVYGDHLRRVDPSGEPARP